MGDIFVVAAEAIIDAQCADGSIRRRIISGLYEAKEREIVELADRDSFTAIKRRLFGAGLVVLESSAASFASSSYSVWSLTDYGQTQYGMLRSLRTGPKTSDPVDALEDQPATK